MTPSTPFASFVVAVRNNLVAIGYGLGIVLFGALTLLLVLRLFRALQLGDTPRVENHWGGFGGGLGGWQLSPSLVFLLASLAFAILTLTTIQYAARDLKPAAAPAPSTSKEGGKTESTPPTPAGTVTPPAPAPTPAADKKDKDKT